MAKLAAKATSSGEMRKALAAASGTMTKLTMIVIAVK
jgi:hypothetical protein